MANKLQEGLSSGSSSNEIYLKVLKDNNIITPAVINKLII